MNRVDNLGLSFFIHKTEVEGPLTGFVVTLDIGCNVAVCLAQACNLPHHDENYFYEHNASSPKIILFFNGNLLSTFYVTKAVQGTVATVVNKVDKSSVV